MKHKIIDLTDGGNNKDVLVKSVLVEVARDGGDDYVLISGWQSHESNNDECYRAERIDFPNIEMCESFVEDFTETSAKSFAATFDC